MGHEANSFPRADIQLGDAFRPIAREGKYFVDYKNICVCVRRAGLKGILN